MKNPRNATTNTDLFATTLPPEYKAVVDAWYPEVVQNVARRIERKCGIGQADAQDIAAASSLYALRSYVNGKRPWPQTQEDWANQATWKATCLARDLIARAKRMPTSFLDEEATTDEGEPLMDSPVMVQASLQVWRDRQAAEERRCRRAAIRYAVPKVVHDMHTRNELRTLKVVEAVYYSQLPIPEVCQRFEGLNRNHLYQILFRFRDCFAEEGRHYMDEFLDNHSDSVRMAA